MIHNLVSMSDASDMSDSSDASDYKSHISTYFFTVRRSRFVILDTFSKLPWVWYRVLQ